MKIGLLCSEYPPALHGGIGPVTRQLAEGLAQDGHIVHVAGLYVISKDTIENINGVTIHRLVRTGHGISGEFRCRMKLTRYLERLHRDVRFDIFEAPEWRGDTALLHINAPIVLRLHTSHVVDRMVTGKLRPGRLIRFFENQALRRANGVCAVSADIARKTAEGFPCFRNRMDRQEVPVILNAVELKTFRPELDTRQTNLLVFAGSLKPKKGVENLLKAFDLVVRQKDCRLALAGADTKTSDGGSYLDFCIGQISAEARSRVDLMGRCSREDVARLFCRGTAVVLPSLQEACPMVVMEAMACGAPTIFGACGPHAEIIDDGLNGLTCNPRSPDNIAEKILFLLNNPAQATKIGTAARVKAERDFTEERFLKQSLDFYAQTIDRYVQNKG